ncbi:methylated-DNA--[protein]-cysteine S-methyltransferase [Microvirga antarctica]|uniref:methylated-DNA--[protein]-cysteine S-methyltransferase n=1 Tax=Microvirga antarctica TaxID=2819233 RepID=UPI001B3008DD|nr:methylated-DNA--[protein]-cysteine S-methyltransferase [Microvirga antarctica]
MTPTLTLRIDRVATPIGEMAIVADNDDGLRAVDWSDHDDRLHRLFSRHYGKTGYVLEPARNPGGLTDAMLAYFEGDLDIIDKLPVATAGTEFQRQVWQELRRIPHGMTITYSELARRIGRPAAIRAVGLANGANPIGIVVPCHRVIGANGTLTGYGGGMARKKWLLAHEGIAHSGAQLPLGL